MPSYTLVNIPTFEACLGAGRFDLAYMNPYHYTVFSEDGSYRAVAHQAEKKLRGLMVVRKDAAFEDISELDGSVLAFPSPGAFGASVLPRAEMINREISFEPRYVKSHDSVYRAVAAGLVQAGGGVTRTLNATPPELRDKLRVIYQTAAYTPHAIAAHERLGESILSQTQAALTTISTDAPELLERLGMVGFEAASHDDWDDVRGLELKPEQAGFDRLDEVTCPFD